MLTGNYSFLVEGAALGNDIYLVSHSSALILETAGEGFDTAKASVSYALGAGVSIEAWPRIPTPARPAST